MGYEEQSGVVATSYYTTRSERGYMYAEKLVLTQSATASIYIGMGKRMQLPLLQTQLLLVQCCILAISCASIMNFNSHIGFSVLGGLYSPDGFAKNITPFTEIVTWLEKNKP